MIGSQMRVDWRSADSAARWAELVPHRDRLIRLAGRKLGSGHEAEDCVHEALLRTLAFEDLDTGRLGAFLTTVTVRLCADRHRATTRARAAAPRLLDANHHDGPEERVCDRLAGASLFGLLAGLPPREQSVLRARANGLSTSEAARHLGISHKAAESAFTRARAKLRNHPDFATAA